MGKTHIRNPLRAHAPHRAADILLRGVGDEARGVVVRVVAVL